MTPPLRNSHLLGSRTRERLVSSGTCPELLDRGIALVGLTEAADPYLMIDRHPIRDYLLICTAGEGRVWVRDRWESCCAGEAYFARIGEIRAFTPMRGTTWHFAWVFYREARSWHRRLPVQTSHLRGMDGQALSSAIEGLYREVNGALDPDMRRYWVALIDNYWKRSVETRNAGGRLALLWERVDQSLCQDWSVVKLAQSAGISDEHLRRLSKLETGRSPMAQVTWLRMARAVTLLQTTSLRLDAVAEAVGYSNAFAFSTAFRRVMGSPPSRYLC